MKKKIYKFIVWFVIIVALGWYLFHLDSISYGCRTSKRFHLTGYKSNLNTLKNVIYSYYSDYNTIPKILDKPLIIAYGRPETALYCCNVVLKTRLFNPIHPLYRQYRTKKIKYSYIYDKTKKNYIVTLESPFEDEPEFKSSTFVIPEGYKEVRKGGKPCKRIRCKICGGGRIIYLEDKICKACKTAKSLPAKSSSPNRQTTRTYHIEAITHPSRSQPKPSPALSKN